MTDSLHSIGVELDHASARTAVQVLGVVTKGSVNVKRQARQFSTGIRHARRYPQSIDFDVTVTASGIEGEIGPEDSAENQGFLGYIYEFGTSQSAPLAHLGPALDREGPGFEKALEDVAGGIL